MDKAQALHSFWSSFGIPAYDTSTVPDEAELPYITYDVAMDHIDRQVQLTASIWYRSTSWTAISQKADLIAEAIGDGGKLLKVDGGYIYIFQGSPFAQRMADEDEAIRRIYLMVTAEFLTAF